MTDHPTPDDPTPDERRTGPAARPDDRNRQRDRAVAGDDPVVARLRTALDELTAGAEPHPSPVTASGPIRRRRWVLPIAAAATVAAVVGVAAVVSGGAGTSTPAARTPTGDPVPTVLPPGPATVPWYELDAEGWERAASGPGHLLASTRIRTQVWASSDFDRVLTVTSDRAWAGAKDLASTMEELGAIPMEDVPGEAWMAPGMGSEGRIVWQPPGGTAVIALAGRGLSIEVLTDVIRTATLSQRDGQPGIEAPLDSLLPFGDSTTPLAVVQEPYRGPGQETSPAGPQEATLMVAEGPTYALSNYTMWADDVLAVTTPFGDGFRIDLPGLTMTWWQIDDGPYWAGFSAPPAEIDALLDHLVRVPDIAVPAPDPDANVATSSGSGSATTAPPIIHDTTQPGDVTASDVSVAASTSPRPASEPPATTSTHAHAATSTTSAATPASVPASTSPRAPDPTSTSPAQPAATVALPRTTVPPAAGAQPPLAVGESVMMSARSSLSEQGIQVDASEVAQAPDIASRLELARQQNRLGDVVIVQAGTNGTMTAADVERMMAAVAEVRRVVVLTVHADAPWIARNNTLIRALPDRYPNVVIADWDAIASATPEVLAADGMHVEDRAAYTDAIIGAAGLG